MPCSRVLSLLLLLSMPVCLFAAECPTDAEIVGQPGMVESEFIYEPVRWPQSHSPTIEEAANGNLVASWFGGTGEGHPDVCIWACYNDGRAWSKPVKVADGIRKDVLRRPCCNPVLFQADSGPLMLFYKLQSLECKTDWQGWKLYSHDGGQTYGDSIALPEGFLGPIKNKPIRLGRWLDSLPLEHRRKRFSCPLRTNRFARQTLEENSRRCRSEKLRRNPTDLISLQRWASFSTKPNQKRQQNRPDLFY